MVIPSNSSRAGDSATASADGRSSASDDSFEGDAELEFFQDTDEEVLETQKRLQTLNDLLALEELMKGTDGYEGGD